MIESTCAEGDLGVAISALTAAHQRFGAVEPASLTSAQLVEAIHQLELHKRRMAAAEHALVAQIDARGVAGEYAYRSTTDLLGVVLRIDRREAAARVRAAGELAPRRTMTGEVLPPLFAHVAAAQAEGIVSPEHARIITRTITELPEAVVAAVDAEPDSDIEGFLVEQARQFDPRTLRIVARRLTDTLNPDGRAFDDADRQRLRAFTLRQHADGTCTGTYRTDAITGEALQTFFDATAQRVADESGKRDQRTADQRRHDALGAWLLRTVRSAELPDTGGVAATIVLTMTPQQLSRPRRCDGEEARGCDRVGFEASGDGLVLTGHGALIALDDALALLGDAQLFPVLHGSTKEVAAYGDTHRIFTRSQRLAMISRDRGCSFPGCTIGPAWCEAHHVTEFSITRRTTVDDGTLLCPFHHRWFERRGWRCVMRDGLPYWIPPRWLDPLQRPRRNQAHLPSVADRCFADGADLDAMRELARPVRR